MSVGKLVEKLNKEFRGQFLLFCYEAGPCGYVLYRQIQELGHHCLVVAPALIPKAPEERIKTDRRDERMLASLLRSGNLTPVWVPDEEQEAMRDLVHYKRGLQGAALSGTSENKRLSSSSRTPLAQQQNPLDKDLLQMA